MSGWISSQMQDDRVAWLDELMVKLDLHFGNDPGDLVRQHVQNVKTKLGDLKGALMREEMQKIAEEVQLGDEVEAALKTRHHFPDLQLGRIQELVQLSYAGNKDNLTNVIRFVVLVSEGQLRLDALVHTFEEVEHRGHLGCVEVLFLRKELICLQALGLPYPDAVRQKLNTAATDITSRMAKDVLEFDSRECVQLANLFGYDVLDSILAEIIQSIGAPSEASVLALIDFARCLSIDCSRAIVVNETYKMLEQHSKLDGHEAFHLWAFVRYHIQKSTPLTQFSNEIRNYAPCASEVQPLLNRVALLCNRSDFLDMYQHAVETQEYATIEHWHVRNESLGSAMVDLIPRCCPNEEGIEKFLPVLHNLEISSAVAGLRQIHSSLVRLQLQETFVCFKMYCEVRRRLQEGSSNSEHVAQLNAIKSVAPQCVQHLLWRDTTECRIVNQFFDQSLSFEPGNRRLTTSDLIRGSEDQQWTISFDPDNYLAALRCHTYDYGEGLFLHQPVGITTAGLLSGVANNFVWRILPTSSEQFKIYDKDGKFFTAEATRGEQTRQVLIKHRDNTTMQLWKIEF